MAHEMDVMNKILKIDQIKEAKGTFGVYDVFVKIEGEASKKIQDVITKQIRKIDHEISTTTLSVIPEQNTK